MDTSPRPRTSSRNPYQDLPAAAFWRSGVGSSDPLAIRDVWRPKIRISRTARIVTAGSCFAQHIARYLTKWGFNWIGPSSGETGSFSFRTGNIYTAAMLKQWVAAAFESQELSREVFREDGRYFDPLRPTTPAEGFSSAEELFADRAVLLREMKTLLSEAEIFIFTLGLTEAWLGLDRSVYPVCPGTVRGVFSSEAHYFHNFSYEEALAGMREVIAVLERVNPRLSVLLTVSPVPLTATASGNHVLPATIYSKSVLRAVAGRLSEERRNVDYFPSYELISSHPFGGRFFAPNLRSVTEEGVGFVMGKFEAALAAAERPDEERKKAAAAPKVVASSHEDDVICEEMALEEWNSAAAESPDDPDVILVGDSHMIHFRAALTDLGKECAGGMTMHGSEWHSLGFLPDEQKLFVPLRSEARKVWEDLYAKTFAQPPERAKKGVVFTNVGMHSHVILQSFVTYLTNLYKQVPQVVDIADLRTYLMKAREAHFALVRRVIDKGYRVVWISDPPLQTHMAEVHAAIDDMLAAYFESLGCEVFRARAWIAENGGFTDDLRSTEINPDTGQRDTIHAGPAYYRRVAAALAERFLASPGV